MLYPIKNDMLDPILLDGILGDRPRPSVFCQFVVKVFGEQQLLLGNYKAKRGTQANI